MSDPLSKHAVMEDYRYTADWFGAHIHNWRNWLGELAGKPDVRFLEVGSYEGRAVVWLLANILTHENASIDCVDPFLADGFYGLDRTRNYEERFDHNVKTALGTKKVRKIKLPSYEALRKLQPYSYHAIYIDGSHNAVDVLEDAVLAFRLLRPNGIMIFDDYGWAEFSDPWLMPRIAIDSFLHIYKGKYELVAHGYQVAVRKR